MYFGSCCNYHTLLQDPSETRESFLGLRHQLTIRIRKERYLTYTMAAAARQRRLIFVLILFNTYHAFVLKPFQVISQRSTGNLILSPTFEGKNDEKNVEVGSKEYLEGFISSPIQDESVSERGGGLEQAIKLSTGVAVVLVALFLGFMASNDLL
jgi:hypothetical protein